MKQRGVVRAWLGAAVLVGILSAPFASVPVLAATDEQGNLPPEAHRGSTANAGDHSGRMQRGEASYYGHKFEGKTMADGRPFRENAHVAASKTLPLGTTARVTNLQNGRSTTVRVEDRGPKPAGRIVDLSTQAAGDLGMKHEGVAPVAVAPIQVPQPDGSVKLGAGAAQE